LLNIEKFSITQIKEYNLLVFKPGELSGTYKDLLGMARTESFSAAFGINNQTPDLDEFDDTYYHIVLWNQKDSRIMGSYRLGLLDELCATKGTQGIYSSSLYYYNEKAIPLLDNTIELGRSFVHPDYQKVSGALAILWGGLSWLTSIKPKYTNFIGMVSVSETYQEVSKWLMVQYMSQKREASNLAGLITPLNPYPFEKETLEEGMALIEEKGGLETLQDLETLVSEIEGGRNLPPILKYYLRYTPIGLITYGRDPDFGNVMDLFSYAPIANSVNNVEKITQRFSLSRVA
jgi:hypothetical protein